MSNRQERRRMSKKERLRKQAEDRARANRRHVDDPDYNEPIDPKNAKFTQVFKPAKEEDLGSEDAEVFRRQKALKEDPDEQEQDQDEEEDEEEEEPEYARRETGERPRSNLSKRDQEMIHSGVNESAGRQLRDRSRLRRKTAAVEQDPEAELESGRDFFAERAGEVFAYLAGFTKYKIPMDDGTFLKVYRVKPPKYELEEFKDMLARYQSGLKENGKAFKTPWETRLSEMAIEDKKYTMFLREVGSDEVIHREDVLHAEDATVPESIAETCLAISLSRWVEGKKLETITNQDR